MARPQYGEHAQRGLAPALAWPAPGPRVRRRSEPARTGRLFGSVQTDNHPRTTGTVAEPGHNADAPSTTSAEAAYNLLSTNLNDSQETVSPSHQSTYNSAQRNKDILHRLGLHNEQ